MQSSQKAKVIAYLETGKTITQAEAIVEFNCYRLSAVINKLRNADYEISTHFEHNYLTRGNHARYELVSSLKPK